MDAVLQSLALVAVSEMGDKTQLLALVLAARFKRPWIIMSGIFVATVLNHALAAWGGSWVAAQVPARLLAWILAASFFAFGAWMLIPDKDEGLNRDPRFGAFVTTVIVFFLAEMGDKTQLVTVALGAKFGDLVAVTMGTTMGMLVADGLAVFLGERLTQRIPMQWVRRVAAAAFFAFGGALLLGA